MLKRKHIAWLVLPITLSACNQVENYMFGKDNTLPATPLKKVVSKKDFSESWSVAAGKNNPAKSNLKLKPMVYGDVVYTATNQGVVTALDKKTGELVWSKQYNYHLVSGPNVSGNYIALASDNAMLILLNRRNGEKLWDVTLSSDAIANPVINRNKVIVKTIDSNLYAFDLKSGNKLWVYDHGSPNLVLKASASPVITDNAALIGYPDGKLDAFDLDTGRLLWERNLIGFNSINEVDKLVDLDADPIVDKHKVYLGSYQGYVGALELANGEFIWKKPASIYKNMVRDGNNLYFTDTDSVIWAIDAEKGHVKWKQLALKAREVTEPVILNHQVLVGDKFGFLHLLAPDTGEIVSRAQVKAPVDVAPAVSGRDAYILTANGKLNKYTLG